MFTSKPIIITLPCPEANSRNNLSQSIISFQLFFPEKSPKSKHRHVHLLTIDSRSPCRNSKFLSRGWRVIIWNTSWYHAILPSNTLLIGLNYQIWKQLDSENKHYACTAELTNFILRVGNLITNIELYYYVNLKANFNLNKFKNLSIRFDR